MIDSKQIDHLANLARLDLNQIEKDRLAGDLEQVINYVSRLKVDIGEIATSITRNPSDNCLRLDTEPHPSGIFSDNLLAAGPETHDGYFVVKSIFSNDDQ